TVSDGRASTSRSVVLHAAVAATPPGVTIELTPGFPVTPGTAVLVHAIAGSLAPITGLTLTLDGQPVTLDTAGPATVTAGAPGKMHFAAVATDADGITGSTTAVLKVRDPNDHTAPVVSFAPTLGRDAITAAVDLTGTVADANLDTWT